jgi:Na+(H+)/acetate symporter ActP
MDMLQLVFGFVNAPLFATFLLGMFWKRTTGHGAFFGLLGGKEIYETHSLGININLIWGAVLLVFGAAMLFLTWRARGMAAPASDQKKRPDR